MNHQDIAVLHRQRIGDSVIRREGGYRQGAGRCPVERRWHVGEQCGWGEKELGPGSLPTKGQGVGKDVVAGLEANDRAAYAVDDACRLDAERERWLCAYIPATLTDDFVPIADTRGHDPDEDLVRGR
jgi:hypothetical protein